MNFCLQFKMILSQFNKLKLLIVIKHCLDNKIYVKHMIVRKKENKKVYK